MSLCDSWMILASIEGAKHKAGSADAAPTKESQAWVSVPTTKNAPCPAEEDEEERGCEEKRRMPRAKLASTEISEKWLKRLGYGQCLCADRTEPLSASECPSCTLSDAQALQCAEVLYSDIVRRTADQNRKARDADVWDRLVELPDGGDDEPAWHNIDVHTGSSALSRALDDAQRDYREYLEQQRSVTAHAMMSAMTH